MGGRWAPQGPPAKGGPAFPLRRLRGPPAAISDPSVPGTSIVAPALRGAWARRGPFATGRPVPACPPRRVPGPSAALPLPTAVTPASGVVVRNSPSRAALISAVHSLTMDFAFQMDVAASPDLYASAVSKLRFPYRPREGEGPKDLARRRPSLPN